MFNNNSAQNAIGANYNYSKMFEELKASVDNEIKELVPSRYESDNTSISGQKLALYSIITEITKCKRLGPSEETWQNLRGSIADLKGKLGNDQAYLGLFAVINGNMDTIKIQNKIGNFGQGKESGQPARENKKLKR